MLMVLTKNSALTDTLKHQRTFGPLTPIALAGTLSLAVPAPGQPRFFACSFRTATYYEREIAQVMIFRNSPMATVLWI
jgi:hypothetical protein